MAVKLGLFCILGLLLGSVPLALADSAAQETLGQRNFETTFDRKEQKRLAKLEKKRQKEEKKQLAREEKQRRKEQKRVAKQEKKRFKEERKLQIVEIARQVKQETEQQQLKCQEETRQKQLAATEKHRLEERAQSRFEEFDRQRQADDRQALALANDIITALLSARWNKDQLSEWVKATSAADLSMASKSTVGRVHLALGLYAYLCDDRGLAQNEWSLAKKWGAKNPRSIADEAWTPRALEIFAGS